jgi:hypothetical protein
VLPTDGDNAGFSQQTPRWLCRRASPIYDFARPAPYSEQTNISDVRLLTLTQLLRKEEEKKKKMMMMMK